MANVLVKLYRNIESAKKAVQDLSSNGFNVEDIGLLIRDEEESATILSMFKQPFAEFPIPHNGTIIAAGFLSSGVKDGDVNQSLISALGITAEGYEYYKFGVLVGGIFISVKVSDDRMSKAQSIIRRQAKLSKDRLRNRTFYEAERMNATNALDASMSGDFRKY